MCSVGALDRCTCLQPQAFQRLHENKYNSSKYQTGESTNTFERAVKTTEAQIKLEAKEKMSLYVE